MNAEQIDQGSTELPQVSSDPNLGSGGCCQFCRSGMLTGILALTTFAAIVAAAYFAGQASKAETTSQLSVPSVPVPLIDATGAVSSETYSMATGPTSDNSEAVFVLDHNSGLLQCSIIYPRARTANKVLGLFTATVTEALGTTGKGGKYIMATGRTDFPSTNSAPVSPTVVYVLDTGSGNWVGYGIPFNRVNLNALSAQQGLMVPVARGTANPIAERE